MHHLARAAAVAILIAITTPLLGQVPALTDPLIRSATPLEAQPRQQVLIEGVNFGTAPEVRFNGDLAVIDVYRADVGRIVATVPDSATSGPLIVTNTDTAAASNEADFEILPGIFSAACTISGNVTDHLGAVLSNAIVVALDAATGSFAGSDLSAAASGTYSVDLGATGNYRLLIFPPEGLPYIQGSYDVTCSGTQNHQFAVGLVLSGHVESDTAAPIPNTWIGVEGGGDFGDDDLTDATGDFTVYLPPDTYEVQVVGPVGGRHIGTIFDASVYADTDLGDIILDSGVIVSGELRYQDNDDSGAVGGAWVADFDSDGELAGLTRSIANGDFHLATPTAMQYSFSIFPNEQRLQQLDVRYVDVAADMELDFPFTMYTTAAQLPQAGSIMEVESLTVQEGERLIFDVAGLRGSSIEAYFPDGIGGTVAGVNTISEVDRGGLVTTVPPAAATGDVVIRIDGADGPGYPLEVAPGIYDPGPHTTTGTITDSGLPVEYTFVGLFELGCENEYLVDYDLTGANGVYSVRHGAGDYALFVLPPVSGGLARGFVPMFGTTGGGTENVALAAGNVVTGICVDSGVGPVGSTDPIPDCEVGAEGVDIEYDDSSVSDDSGTLVLNLPTGTYDLELRPPFESRYLYDPGVSTFVITEDVDLGDAAMDSGFLVEGRIEDQAGNGLAGIEVSLWNISEGEDAGLTRTSGSEGRFRLAVPLGVYHLFTSVHPDQEQWVASEFSIVVSSDLLLYPARQAEIAGHLRGTVVDSSMTPLEELPVQAFHETYGFVRMADTCYDGSYDLKVPAGDYVIQAIPSWEGLCLADEFYDGFYIGCGANQVTLTAPGTLSGLDFVLEPAGSISGTVAGDGGPVAGATVCATSGSSNPICYDGCTTTGADGSFTLSNVPVASDYQVDAVGFGYPWECWSGHVGCHDYDPVAVADCVYTPLIDFSLSNSPGPVPVGDHVAGTPMTVRRGASYDEVIIDWQPTCDANDHVIYFGTLGSYSTYAQAECSAGPSGSWQGAPPAGDLFWVVAGVNGSNEGSYGEDGNGFERPSEGGLLCGYTQDLSATCLPAADAPGAVPDGNHVAGSQMTARAGASAGEIIIDWQPTCDANDHAIYFGAIGNYASYTDAVCDAGMSGSWSLMPPGGDIFWLVVGVNGLREGSYGVDSGITERPDDGGVQCSYVQDLGATCVP